MSQTEPRRRSSIKSDDFDPETLEVVKKKPKKKQTRCNGFINPSALYVILCVILWVLILVVVAVGYIYRVELGIVKSAKDEQAAPVESEQNIGDKIHDELEKHDNNEMDAAEKPELPKQISERSRPASVRSEESIGDHSVPDEFGLVQSADDPGKALVDARSTDGSSHREFKKHDGERHDATSSDKNRDSMSAHHSFDHALQSEQSIGDHSILGELESGQSEEDQSHQGIVDESVHDQSKKRDDAEKTKFSAQFSEMLSTYSDDGKNQMIQEMKQFYSGNHRIMDLSDRFFQEFPISQSLLFGNEYEPLSWYMLMKFVHPNVKKRLIDWDETLVSTYRGDDISGLPSLVVLQAMNHEHCYDAESRVHGQPYRYCWNPELKWLLWEMHQMNVDYRDMKIEIYTRSSGLDSIIESIYLKQFGSAASVSVRVEFSLIKSVDDQSKNLDIVAMDNKAKQWKWFKWFYGEKRWMTIDEMDKDTQVEYDSRNSETVKNAWLLGDKFTKDGDKIKQYLIWPKSYLAKFSEEPESFLAKAAKAAKSFFHFT